MHKSLFTVIIAWLIIILSFLSCQYEQTTEDKINSLRRQLEADSVALGKLKNEAYPEIAKTFHFCDSLLAFIEESQWQACFEKLNLTQAYIQQFRETQPLMKRNFDYSLEQTSNLINDLHNNYINDSLALAYLQVELQVADTLHNQVQYFQQHFDDQKKALESVKKKVMY